VIAPWLLIGPGLINVVLAAVALRAATGLLQREKIIFGR
jgi:hypothetical protein